MRAVIKYRHRASGNKELREFRLVCNSNLAAPIGQIEVLDRDALGEPSWRPCQNTYLTVEGVLARALFASQMTPIMRLNAPDRLHPEGVTYINGDEYRVEVDLGTVTT